MKYEQCLTEQQFKMEWIRRHKKEYIAVFPIETEETVKGFPDVLAIHEFNKDVQTPYLLEFKKARNGVVEFQSTQPAFYKANPKLYIYMIALVKYEAKTYVISLPSQIVMDCLKGKTRLDLRRFCTTEFEVGEE